MLIDRDVIASVADWLRPDAFYSHQNALIYRAMKWLWEQRTPCDYVTLYEALSKYNKLDEAGGAGYLAELGSVGAIPVHAPFYAETITKLAHRRSLIDSGSQLVAAAYADDVDLDEAVGMVRRASEQFQRPAETASGMHAETMDDQRRVTEQRWAGTLNELVIPTGLRSIDRLMWGGLREGDLMFMGGRPGMGKTSSMLQMAHAAAQRTGRTALIVELEMSAEALRNRAICAKAGVPFRVAYEQIGDPWHRELWLQASADLEQIPVAIETKLNTTDKIRAYVERMAMVNPVGVIFIDHLDYLGDKTKGEFGEQRTSELVRRLKALGMATGVPVVALSQLNRAVEETSPYMPTLKSFKQSGEIEGAADYALLYYRRKYYVDKGMLQPDSFLDVCADGRHKVELLMAKNRNGEVSTVNLGWQAETMTFHEVAA